MHHIKIGKKNDGAGNEAYRIQFGSVLFYQWLNNIGLTSNKSKTIGKLNIPEEFFFDFFRGVWDGDGTIYAYWDPRWESSYMFYIAITSASRSFLEWLNSEIRNQIQIEGRITRNSTAYQLRFAKQGSRTLFKHMHYSKDIPYLTRKFAKAQKIFRIDENHT